MQRGSQIWISFLRQLHIWMLKPQIVCPSDYLSI
jgi:hypothetical protein